jgi:hypothetical protein
MLKNRKCGVMARKLTPKMMEHINRRRRQVHLHSIVYYTEGDNLIDDHTWDRWARELKKLQRMFPACLDHEDGYLNEVFINWTGDTGMHLPWCPKMYSTYLHLKRYKEKQDAEAQQDLA